MYQSVARLFAERINAVFETETALEDEFKKNFGSLPFDRTNHWEGIIYNILTDCWLETGPAVHSDPTGIDRILVLQAWHPLVDYNLFSQVFLNSQEFSCMGYLAGDAEKEIARLQEAWPKDRKLNPFAPKARMVKQAEIVSEEQREYNVLVSRLKALRIISQFTPQISFRVSPKGSTPALADSRNLSMIGEGGDKYLRTLPGLGVFYLTWSRVPRMALHIGNGNLVGLSSVPFKGETGVSGLNFKAEGIPYPFFSKSGGDILQDVLFVRRLIYLIFAEIDTTKEPYVMVPRMNSILIVTDKEGKSLKSAVDKIKTQYPMLDLVEGPRA